MVAKTLARQFSKEVEDASAPFQFALSTRAGVDGIGAHDHVFRETDVVKTVGSSQTAQTVAFRARDVREPIL